MSDEKEREEKQQLAFDAAVQFLGPRLDLFNSIVKSFTDSYDAAETDEQKGYFHMVLCAMYLARRTMERGAEVSKDLTEFLSQSHTAYVPPMKVLRAAMQEVGMDPEKNIQQPTPEQCEALAERLRKWKVEKKP